MKRKSYVVAYIVVFLTVIFVSSLLLQDSFAVVQEALGRYADQHSFLAPFMFVAFAALSVMLGPFTSAPLVSFAVALWGTLLTFVLLVIGWLLGNSLAYWIGHSIGYPLVRRIVSKEKLRKWTTFLSDKVGTRLLFLFRLATPSEVGYVFGILRYRFFHYLIISLLAELPFALLIVFAGEAVLGNRWELLVGLMVAGFTLILGSLYLLKALETKRGKR